MYASGSPQFPSMLEIMRNWFLAACFQAALQVLVGNHEMITYLALAQTCKQQTNIAAEQHFISYALRTQWLRLARFYFLCSGKNDTLWKTDVMIVAPGAECSRATHQRYHGV